MSKANAKQNTNIAKATQANKDSNIQGVIMQTRYLELSNFKNIGVSEQNNAEIDIFELDEVSNFTEKPQRIYLNNNLSEDKQGGLVIIVGENNTGKSNIAKALSKFSFEEMLDNNDKPNFTDYEDCYPRLKLVVNNGWGG